MIATAKEIRDTADGGTPEEIKNIVNLITEGPLRGVGTEADFHADLNGNEYRFIHNGVIDDVIATDLKDDPYHLGCFNADFLCHYIPLSSDQIKHVQAAEGFEAIGLLVLAHGELDELVSDMISADGYGHYFNHYNGDEIELNNVPYRMFQQ
tara:strand:+ start:1144 stop:1599 length:456 start_codon:yes stop_codon:yes gene_type:complete